MLEVGTIFIIIINIYNCVIAGGGSDTFRSKAGIVHQRWNLSLAALIEMSEAGRLAGCASKADCANSGIVRRLIILCRHWLLYC